MNRRAFLRLGVLAGAGAAAAMASAMPRGAWAAFRALIVGGSSIRFDFASAADRPTWGPRWLPLHFARRADVQGGAARFLLPAGLETTAPTQPMPIFLLDCDASSGTQVMTFTISNATLRAGMLFEGRPPFAYLAVTIEGGDFVLARYFRRRRVVLERIPGPRLRTGIPYTLKVARSSSRARAKLWSGSREPENWRLDVPLGQPKRGCFGVLLVHPSNRRAATLNVRHYRLSVPGRFSATRPAVAFAVSGIPADSGGGNRVVRVRAASSLPSAIEFEWYYDEQNGAAERTGEHFAASPPYTAVTEIAIPTGSEAHWRARIRSLSSSARTLAEWHSVGADVTNEPIVLAAGACAHVWNKPTLAAFERATLAAPAPIRAVVCQGDLGYANNSHLSCYLAADDFFADRFGRFLADPKFAALRRSSSVGFTLDDHDYGPRNNAWKETVELWAIQLWNRMHADSSELGYFDFRFADVHCMTLDNRRYADRSNPDPAADVSRLGADQFAWLEALLTGSDAELFVLFSAGIFASRKGSNDCFLFGWRREYDRAMSLFHDVQLDGRRVVIVSGDAHGFRVHHHPDPSQRPGTAGLSVVEFVCAGLEARTWTPAVAGDSTLDTTRSVMGTSGLGLVVVDPPGVPDRAVTLRAIPARTARRSDLFRRLVLPFRPEPSPLVPLAAPQPRPWLRPVPQE